VQGWIKATLIFENAMILLFQYNKIGLNTIE
jgi:hypothetical protein